jgi:photosystem II stability/assembly factor-like uncharacterized protein
MNRAWTLLAFLIATACTGIPSRPPQTRPRPVPDRAVAAHDGEERSAREEWFLRRLREADGTIRDDASARGARSWQAWSAGHAPGQARGKAASPLGARSWQEIGPRNVAGRVLAVAFDPVDPNILWAGSAGGGLYRSVDFGLSWSQIGGDHLPSLWIGAIAVDPNHPDTLYLGTGEANEVGYVWGGFGGLLKTTDAGRTFTRIDLPESAFYRVAVSTADSDLVLVAARTGLYRSADAGGHFTRKLPGGFTDFAQDPKNPSRFVAVHSGVSDGGLFESLDAGLTWHLLGTGLPSGFWGRGAVAFPAPPATTLNLAVAVGDALGPSFFRSPDDGRSWERVVIDSTQGYTGVSNYGGRLAVAPQDESFVAQANGHYILLSQDAGRHWSLAGGDWHVDTHDIAFHPRFPSRAALATDGGVAVSLDGGTSFQRVELGFPTVQFYTCAIGLLNPVSLFGGTQDNAMTIYRGDPARGWERSRPPGPGDVMAISIHPTRTNEVLAVTAEGLGIGLSHDEGRTWESSSQGFIGDDLHPWVTRLARSPLHPEQVYVGGSYLTASADGGRSWQPTLVRPLDGNRFDLQIADLSISPAGDTEIWTVWRDGKVFVSADAGATWRERSPPGGARAGLRISAGPVRGTAYVALSGTTGARLFRTRDGGATWDDISRDLPELPLNAVLADPRAAGRLFVATDAGVALSVDDGRTWQDASGALPNAVVFDLCLDPASGRLAAATYGRGLWELAPPPPCRADATTLCLNRGRFEVKAHWTAPTGTGEAQAVPLTSDTGYFWFFDPANVEAVVKVIDACGLNRTFWTFAGGLTNLQTVLTLRDTLTGDVKTYTNPQGTAFQPIQDVDAFPTCDALSKAAPAGAHPALAGLQERSASGSSLLLNQERFKVDVTWETADGQTGTGVPVALTSDTGYFWFFNASNVEMVIKVLKGCGFNGNYWVFAGGLTDVRTVLTVTDTLTNQVRTYVNPQKTAFHPIQDVTAFASCP